jgi:hypothetical protein
MIPKVIHKVIIVDGGEMPVLPDGIKNAIETFYRKNPDYKVKLYSGNACVEYIKQHFDEEVLNAYNTLKPYAYKCDLMRHLILYNEGGWYSDMRQICLAPIDKLNDLNKEYYTSLDCPPNDMCMYTAFIGSVSKHPISKKMFDLILWNVKQQHYGLDCLYPTGPGAYMNASIDYIRKYPQKCLVGQHTNDEYVRFGDINFIKCKYNNARGADNSDIKCGNDYGVMWRNRQVYSQDQIGFIILRHVNDKKTDIYWKTSYDHIRKFYPENEIVIIDDNSDKNILTEKKMYKTKIINSEYPGRGELLPYYYYLKYNFFETAVIIHDSVFINKYIDFKVDTYKFLWDFKHQWDHTDEEIKFIEKFNSPELLSFYKNKDEWVGCFGCMCSIKHEYLKRINEKHNLNVLLDVIKTRYNRESFERVIACMLQMYETHTTLLGDIHEYMKWGVTYNEIENYKDLPIIKIWTGR